MRASAAVLALALGAAAQAGDDPYRRLAIGGECVDCDFADQNLSHATFFGADLSRSDFSDSELSRANFFESRFAHANFSDAEMMGAQFRGVSFANADFNGADLSESRFERVNFSAANLQETDFSESALILVAFSGANLNGAHFQDAEIHEGRFRRAELTGASFRDAVVHRGDFNEAHGERASFRDADLTGADFTGAHLARANFRGAVLHHARLSGADLSEARGLTKSALMSACGDEDTRLPLDLTLPACQGHRNVARLVGVQVHVEGAEGAEYEEGENTFVFEVDTEAEIQEAMRARMEAMRALEAVLELETGDAHTARHALREVERELRGMEIEIIRTGEERAEVMRELREAEREAMEGLNEARRDAIRQALRDEETRRQAVDRARRDARRRVEILRDSVAIERGGAGVVVIDTSDPSDREIWLWPHEEGGVGYRYELRGAPVAPPPPPAPPAEPADAEPAPEPRPDN